MMRISLADGKRYLWQWDLNQRLALADIPAGTQVHFARNDDAEDNALVRVSYDEQGAVYADVPNTMLQQAGEIDVYVYIVNNERKNTELHWPLLVFAREKPADYVYTEDEVKTWEALDERLKKVEEGGTGGAVEIPTKVSAFENDAGYLTEHQDLSGYAKTEDVPTDDHINSLINTALGVIENGYY